MMGRGSLLVRSALVGSRRSSKRSGVCLRPLSAAFAMRAPPFLQTRDYSAKEADKMVYNKFKEHDNSPSQASDSDVQIAKNNARIFGTNWMIAVFAAGALAFIAYIKFAHHETVDESIKRHEK